MAVGGLVLATASGFKLHLLPGKVALLVFGPGYLIHVILFATIPSVDPKYWAYIFPAMLGATLGGDVTYGVSNIFITSSLPKRMQGLAGAVINSVLFLGMSFFLGFADMVESSQKIKMNPAEAYNAVFWFAPGSAFVSLIIIVAFVRIGKPRANSRLMREPNYDWKQMRSEDKSTRIKSRSYPRSGNLPVLHFPVVQ
jgi:hypothetical protein